MGALMRNGAPVIGAVALVGCIAMLADAGGMLDPEESPVPVPEEMHDVADPAPRPPKTTPPEKETADPSPPPEAPPKAAPVTIPTPPPAVPVQAPPPTPRGDRADALAKAAAKHDADDRSARTAVETAPVGDGPALRLGSLGDLEGLVRGGHIGLHVQYADGTRYALEISTVPPTAREVPPETFRRWIAEGRVQALVASPELMDSFQIHEEEVTYLAVLSDALLGEMDRHLAEQGLSRERSIVRLHDGPRVTVALARK